MTDLSDGGPRRPIVLSYMGTRDRLQAGDRPFLAEMIGRTLSHFRIVAKIGSGGMAEVYRATDTRLGREGAVEVLPDKFARDPERLARFQREEHRLRVDAIFAHRAHQDRRQIRTR